MSPSSLAEKLQTHSTILPSQRELLERVLFQIEFNGCQHIHLQGGPGSGKTTLCLVLAELLSESMNLAYFPAPQDMTTAQCQKQLLQQWFGAADLDADLSNLLQQRQNQPLALVLDGQGALPLACLAQLRAHPVHIITTSNDFLPEADLNLTIATLSEAEVEQLLPVKALHTMPAAERLQTVDGNLHRLLEPQASPVTAPPEARNSQALHYRTASLLLAGIGLFAVLLFWWLYPAPVQESHQADNQGPLLAEAWRPADTGYQGSDSDGEEKLDAPEASNGHDEPSFANETRSDPGPVENAQAETEVQTEPQHRTEKAAELSASPEPLSNDDSLLQEPLSVETEVPAWSYDEALLLAMASHQYVLQLGAFAQPAAAERVRSQYSELSMLIYQRTMQQQPQWVLVLAPYASADEARAKRTELPALLQAETPFIKAMQQVWSEIDSVEDAGSNLP